VSQSILLKDKAPDDVVVDPERIGISYSGGGPLVLVELGIARALVQEGIIPSVISGVSAGALAGTAHALDVHNGAGITMAEELLGRASNCFLGLTAIQVIGRVMLQREQIASLGDNTHLGPLLRAGLMRDFDLRDVTVGTFGGPCYPQLMIAATDARDGSSVWFPDDTAIEDALIASSAIPGVFPWKTMIVSGRERTLVDGGVVTNQPLANLVKRGCGTIYACASAPTGILPPPSNGLDNALRSVSLMMHQYTKLEQEYVRLKLQGKGVVHHIHPRVTVPNDEYDFSPELVKQVIDEACAATRQWLSERHPA
jgi:predicted acylesterase/phospholipase RssA